MRNPIRRRGRTAALLAAVATAAGLATLVGPGAVPAGAVQSDSIPIPFGPSVSGPQSGTLANGVTWSVDKGAGDVPDQGYYIYPSDSPQTWTFSEPVSVTFTVAGLNCSGEAMQLPVGSVAIQIGTGHSYDPATGVVTGGGGATAATGSTFLAPGLRTDLVLGTVGAGSCGRGPSAIDLDRPEPFDCSTSTVFIAQDVPTQLQRLVAGSGSSDFEDVGTPTITYNSMAYNLADDLIYGATGNGDIVAVDSTGAALFVGTPTPGIGSNNIGAIGPDGKFYVGAGGSSTLNVVDLATLANTPITLDAPAGTADLTFIDGLLWGDGGLSGGLTRIDPATGHVSRFPTSIPNTVTAGAAWTYPNGNLGLSDNNSGNVYQVRIVDPASDTPTFEVVSVSPGPSSSQNDGTACEGLPADLSLTKTSNSPVLPGGQITWTITVTNNGPGTSTGYVVSDAIPAGVTDLSSPTPGCSFAGNLMTCTGGVLGAGDSAVITVLGTAPADAGVVDNQASVVGNDRDPDPSNDSTSSRTTVAAPAGLCRGTAVSVLGIRLGSANNPESPCVTRTDHLVNINQTIGNALPWPLSFLNSKLRANAVGGSTLSGPGFASAEAHVATASVSIPTLGISLAVTGVQTTAASQLGTDCSSVTVTGSSVIAAVVLNGVPIVIGDQPVSIPLLGLGGLYLNQRVVQGGTIIQRAVFLDLPGTALDVAIAESKAGVACV